MTAPRGLGPRAAAALGLAAVAVLATAGGAEASAEPLEVRGLEAALEAPEDAVLVTATVQAPEDGPTAGLLRLVVHERATSRSALREALDGGALGPAVGSSSTAVDEIEAGQRLGVVLETTGEELGLGLAPPGVYPAVLDLQLDEARTQVRTAVIVADPTAGPLRLATVRDLAAADDGLGDLLEGAAIPLTVVAGHDEATDPIGLGAALEGHAAVARPRDRADIVALVAAGQEGAAERAVSEGRERLATELDVDVAAGVVAPAAPVDAATAAVLRDAGLDAVLLDEEDLGLAPDRPLPRTPAAVRALDGGAGLVAAVPDPWASTALANGAPALAAQRALAETAAAHLERPEVSGRGLVLAAGDADAAAVDRFAEAADAAPWLHPTTLPDLAARTTPEDGVAPPADAGQAALPAEHVRAVADARARLAVLDDVLDDPERSQRLARDLDRAIGIDARDDPAARAAPIEAVERLGAEVSRTLAVPTTAPITLTGLEGTVPVALANEGDEALRVRVRLVTARHEVVDDGRVVELPPGEEAVEVFTVTSRVAGGSYPVGVELHDPEGRELLLRDQVVVRSTAVTVPAVVATVGAGALLVAWVGWDASRRRRGGPA